MGVQSTGVAACNVRPNWIGYGLWDCEKRCHPIYSWSKCGKPTTPAGFEPTRGKSTCPCAACALTTGLRGHARGRLHILLKNQWLPGRTACARDTHHHWSLSEVPEHRSAWPQLAEHTQYKYIRFVHAWVRIPSRSKTVHSQINSAFCKRVPTF